MQRPIGLLDLPAEIKNRIYRLALTSPKPICFNERFPRKLLSPHLLRCCKTVCQEGTAILYAENAFIVSKPGDLVALRRTVPDNVAASLIKSIVFSCQFEQGQELINKTRLVELRSFRGLESIVIEEQLYERPRRKIALKDGLRLHRNFESVRSLVASRPEVRIIYRAWYHGKVGFQQFSLLQSADHMIVHRTCSQSRRHRYFDRAS